MTSLSFVIPTYNRPDRLKRAVESIAEQITPEMTVDIRIVENCRLDTVREQVNALAGGPVSITSHANGDYSDAFRHMFRAAPDSDWVWTFGDDDILCPGALAFFLQQLEKMGELSFVHIAERSRASGRNALVYAPTLLDLCNAYGWTEMTGYISGNVTRGAVLAKAADTPHWRTYAKSAYVQSAAILEALKDERCAFMEIPLIDAQDAAQTPETLATWGEQKIGERYLQVVDAIECMFDHDILTQKLQPAFFRYLNQYMWDRFFVLFLSDFLDNNSLWPDESWSRIAKFAQFIADEKMAAKLRTEVELVKQVSTVSLYLSNTVDALRKQVYDIGKEREKGPFPYTFIERVAAPAVKEDAA